MEQLRRNLQNAPAYVRSMPVGPGMVPTGPAARKGTLNIEDLESIPRALEKNWLSTSRKHKLCMLFHKYLFCHPRTGLWRPALT